MCLGCIARTKGFESSADHDGSYYSPKVKSNSEYGISKSVGSYSGGYNA